jgi:hypothetical protein
MFQAKMHYFEVSKLRCIHHTLLDPKRCLIVFWTISLTYGHKKMKNLCFGPECTSSGYETCKASILLHWTQNDVWGCFKEFC